jgi:integrase
MIIPAFLSTNQVANALHIKPYTINALVRTNAIPYTYIKDMDNNHTLPRFDPDNIAAWLANGAKPDTLDALKDYYAAAFPDAIKALKEIDSHYVTRRQAKGYSLGKVANKELGYVYYVRYIEKGKVVPSRWSTGTNDLAAAEQFALDHRETLLTAYHEKKRLEHDPYLVMPLYYQKDSPYLDIDTKRGRVLGEHSRSNYQSFIVNVFIPFLKSEHIRYFSQITLQLLIRFQNFLLLKDMKPQTIRRNMSGLRVAFNQYVTAGLVPDNVFDKLPALTPKQGDITERGCHTIQDLRGVFSAVWDNTLSYLLSLIIHTTNMRNCEIDKLQAKDIITIEDCAFIDIPASKTVNGVRVVPLHPFVHAALAQYIKDTGKLPDDYLFSDQGKPIHTCHYHKSCADMGKLLGMTEAELKAQHITYYSGRHYWKTLMNDNDLGDVEEVFMGHKVSGKVAESYNHRDKQGKEKLVRKAKEVFGILDRELLSGTKPAKPSPEIPV